MIQRGENFIRLTQKRDFFQRGVILPLPGRRSLEFRLLVILLEGDFEEKIIVEETPLSFCHPIKSHNPIILIFLLTDTLCSG
jgi:hypothetical protein